MTRFFVFQIFKSEKGFNMFNDTFNVDAYSEKLHLSEEARTLLRRIVTLPPSRRVQSKWGNLCCRFPSRKMGWTVSVESRSEELIFAWKCEYDPLVLAYYDQPVPLKITIPPSGKTRKITYLSTLDFCLLYDDHVVFIECKPVKELDRLSTKNKDNIFKDDFGKWHNKAVEVEVSRLGFEFQIISDVDLDNNLLNNLRFIDDYFKPSCPEVPVERKELILTVINEHKGISLFELLTEYSFCANEIYTLLARCELFIDLSRCEISRPDLVKVFADYETSFAMGWVSTTFDPIENVFPNTISIQPNEQILWDGKVCRILNVGCSNVTIVNEDNSPVDLSLGVFDELVKAAKISFFHNQGNKSIEDKKNEILMAANPAQLQIATYRYRQIEPLLKGKSITEIYLTVAPRTARAWVSKYRKAQLTYNYGFIGLIPKPKSGNHTSRYGEIVDRFIFDFIKSNQGYLDGNGRQINKTQSLIRLNDLLEKEGYSPVSLKKYNFELQKYDIEERTKLRFGSKAAYAISPPYLNSKIPPHGVRSFEIGHIDHTTIDYQFRYSKTGKLLGKAYLTIMIDDHDRRILAVYISFNPASSVSDLMVIRDCVRRHKRIPSSIITDKGADFESISYETLLAYLEITKISRPPNKPRSGSNIERMIETTNEELIYTLLGNTQASKSPRNMDPKMDPKKVALWDLPSFFRRLCEWSFDEYNNCIHPALYGLTPNQAYEQDLVFAGSRDHTYIPYDESFFFLTLPDAKDRGGKRKLQPGKGIKMNGIYFYSSELDRSTEFNKLLHVKYNPGDAGSIFVFHQGHYVQCFSREYESLKGRSWREVELSSEEIIQCNLQNQNNWKLNSKIRAEGLRKTSEQENILLQRYKDIDSECIEAEINKDFHLSQHGYILNQSSISEESQQKNDTEIVDNPKKLLPPKPTTYLPDY